MTNTMKGNLLSKITSFLLISSLAFFVLLPFMIQQVNAADATSAYIEDEADIFTSEEEETLTKEMNELQKEYNVDVVILTVDGRYGYSVDSYIEAYFDSYYDEGLLSEDVVICLRDVNDRMIGIQGYGKAETYITSSRIDTILDDMTSDLEQDLYYDAFLIYLDDLDTYLNTNPNPLTWTWVQALIGLAIGGIITLIMVSHSKGKVTTNSRTYLDEAHSGLVAKRDMYITTTVSRIHKPKSSSGGGGVSPGGHSHSSGSRRI